MRAPISLSTLFWSLFGCAHRWSAADRRKSSNLANQMQYHAYQRNVKAIIITLVKAWQRTAAKNSLWRNEKREWRIHHAQRKKKRPIKKRSSRKRANENTGCREKWKVSDECCARQTLSSVYSFAATLFSLLLGPRLLHCFSSAINWIYFFLLVFCSREYSMKSISHLRVSLFAPFIHFYCKREARARHDYGRFARMNSRARKTRNFASNAHSAREITDDGVSKHFFHSDINVAMPEDAKNDV